MQQQQNRFTCKMQQQTGDKILSRRAENRNATTFYKISALDCKQNAQKLDATTAP
jgi:hypothetical protein